jgi:hypothetical protein
METEETKNRLFQVQLFNAGKIAIPLKKQSGSKIKPQPNFLVIESIFDYISAKFPNSKGELEETECQNSYMRLVYREILPEEKQKNIEIREVLCDQLGNIPIPEDFVTIFKNHQRMIDNALVINTFLPMFNFRGYLKGHKLEYDESVSEKYLILLDEIKNPSIDVEINSLEQEFLPLTENEKTLK